MDFKISKIILWPKNPEMTIRVIPFKGDFVNVISGDNARGKSAIISIIDYCLASSKCSIPIGLIRNLTSWFGIVISYGEEEILLAREEPGVEVVSNNMYIQRGKKIAIPEQIEGENANYRDIINELNKLAQLAKFDLGDKGISQPASIRDLVSLNFQPQHLVANPYALFYKADTYQNREKLITIFPYILGILDDELLGLKEELKDLKSREKSLGRELEQRKNIANNWLSEVKSYYALAFEFGLIDGELNDTNAWTPKDYIVRLRQALTRIDRNIIPLVKVGASTKISQRLAELDEKEYQTAAQIQEKKEKLYLIQSVKTSNTDYGNDILVQNSRLEAVSWLKSNINKKYHCPFCGSKSTSAQEYVDSFYTLSNELSNLSRKVADSHRVFNKEITSINSDLNKLEVQINDIRTEKQILSQENEEYQKQHQVLNSIFRFGGKLEESLKNYDKISESGDLEKDMEKVKKRIAEINKQLNQDVLDRKQKGILNQISTSIKHYAKIFEAEYCDDDIQLNIENLTLKFVSGNREDFLWEIGSGHNFMSYHISTILAIHEYLLTLDDKNRVPSFIIFDQPSQVYFPELKKEELAKDEAVLKVKRIFKVLSEFKNRTASKVQTIIIEHAGENSWNEYSDDVKLIRNWHGDSEDNALIPKQWIDAKK
jgi:predicted nuclease of restriction endonuclease-like (RecB) superfamily